MDGADYQDHMNSEVQRLQDKIRELEEVNKPLECARVLVTKTKYVTVGIDDGKEYTVPSISRTISESISNL